MLGRIHSQRRSQRPSADEFAKVAPWLSGRSARSTSSRAVVSEPAIAALMVGTPRSSATRRTLGPGWPPSRRTSSAGVGGRRAPVAGRSASTPRTTWPAATFARAPAPCTRGCGATTSPPHGRTSPSTRSPPPPSVPGMPKPAGRLARRRWRSPTGCCAPSSTWPLPTRPSRPTRAGCGAPARPRPTVRLEHSLQSRRCSWPSNWGETGEPSATARSRSFWPSAVSGSVRPLRCAAPTSCPAADCAWTARSAASAADGSWANPRPRPDIAP
jgi:hypothetical protein